MLSLAQAGCRKPMAWSTWTGCKHQYHMGRHEVSLRVRLQNLELNLQTDDSYIPQQRRSVRSAAWAGARVHQIKGLGSKSLEARKSAGKTNTASRTLSHMATEQSDQRGTTWHPTRQPGVEQWGGLASERTSSNPKAPQSKDCLCSGTCVLAPGDPGVLDPEEGLGLLKAMAGKVGGLPSQKSISSGKERQGEKGLHMASLAWPTRLSDQLLLSQEAPR